MNDTPAAQPDEPLSNASLDLTQALDDLGHEAANGANRIEWIAKVKAVMLQHEAAAVAQAEKALLEQLSAKLQEYIDFPIKSNTAVESSLKQTRLGHIQAKRLIDVELQRHAQEGGAGE